MTLYVLDTDHLSLYGRNHPTLMARLRATQTRLQTAERKERDRILEATASAANALLTADV